MQYLSCPKCGSVAIDHLEWVDVNTGEIHPDEYAGEAFCNSCEAEFDLASAVALEQTVPVFDDAIREASESFAVGVRAAFDVMISAEDLDVSAEKRQAIGERVLDILRDMGVEP